MPPKKVLAGKVEKLFQGISNVWGQALGVDKLQTLIQGESSTSYPVSRDEKEKEKEKEKDKDKDKEKDKDPPTKKQSDK
ncbi:hypothetical protein GCK32_007251, partial [Trichostrongylus colubriformis]